MPSTKMLRIAPEVIDMDVSSHGAVNIAQHASGDSSGTYVVGVNKFPGGDFVLDVSGNIRCHSIQLDGGSIAGGGSGPWDVNEDNNKIYYNDGSVGVGTNDPNPTFQVDVSGALNCTQLYVDGELFTISGEDITTTGRWDKSGNRVYYDDNGAGGLVGINTSNPATALDVSGDITAHTIHIGTTGIIGGRRGTDISEITIWVGVNDASNDFVFYTDASATELLEIDEDGNKILYAGKTYTFITLESDFPYTLFSENRDFEFDVSWNGSGVSKWSGSYTDGLYNLNTGAITIQGIGNVEIEDSFIDSSLNYSNTGVGGTINGSFSVIENRRILPIEADVDVSGIVSCDKLFIADTEFGTANLNKWIHDDTNNQLSYSDGDVVINNALMCENINLNTVDVGAGETIHLWVGYFNTSFSHFRRARYGYARGAGCQFFTRNEYNVEYELYPFNTLYMNKRYVFHRLTGWTSQSAFEANQSYSEGYYLYNVGVYIFSNTNGDGIFDISSNSGTDVAGADLGIVGDQTIELSFNAVDTSRHLAIRNAAVNTSLVFNLVASDQGNGTLDISGDIKSHTSTCENLRIPEYPVNSGEIVYIYVNPTEIITGGLTSPYFEFYYMESTGSDYKLATPPLLYLNKTYRFIKNHWADGLYGNGGLGTFHFGISGDLSKYTIEDIEGDSEVQEFGDSRLSSNHQILELKFTNMTESDSEDINAFRYYVASAPDMSGAFRFAATEMSPGSLDLSGDMNVTGNILLNGQDILSKLSPWDLCGNNNISYTDGYVGIGKDPTELLDVSGDIAADGINLNNIFGNMEGGTDTSHNIWVDISASSNRFLFYKDASRNTLFESNILYSDKQYTFKVLFDEGGVEDLGVGLRMVELGDASNTFFLDTTDVSNIVTLVNNDLLTTEGDGVYDRGIFNAKDDGLVNIDSGIINEGTYTLDVSTNFTGDRILRFSDEGTAGTNISGEFILRENRSIVTAQTDVKVEGKMTVTRDVTLEGDLDVSGDFILGGVSLSTNITTQVNTQIAASSSWVKDLTSDIVYNTTDKIGIGTSSPNEALDVSGNVAIDGSLNVSNHVNIGSAVVGLKGDVPTGASVKPTHAWEFRGGAAGDTSPVYDLVNGVSADPASADRDASGIVFDSSSSIMDVGNVSLQSAFTMEFYFYYDGKQGATGLLLDFIQFDDIKIQNGYGNANNLYVNDSTTPFNTTGEMVTGFVHLLISTESDGTATLYVNNVLDVSDDISFTPGDITNMKIGNIDRHIGSTPSSGNYYNEFTLLYFRIWDGVALGNSEVGQLYSNRDTIESPVLHFQVNDQTPVSVTDAGLEVSGNLMVNNQDIVTLITNASTAASTWEISNNSLYNIDFNNNVGIGTKTPSEALEVSGNAKVSEILSVGQLRADKDIPAIVDISVRFDTMTPVGVEESYFDFYINDVKQTHPFTIDLNKIYRFTRWGADGVDHPFYISDNGRLVDYSRTKMAITGDGGYNSGIVAGESFTLMFHSLSVNDTLTYYCTTDLTAHTHMEADFTLQGRAGPALDVSGNVGVIGNVTIGKKDPSSTKALDVSGDAVIDGALEVNGNVTMAGGTAHRIEGGNMTISGGDLTIDNGTLTIKMGGNLVIEDPDISYTDLKTVVKISDQLDISNEGTGPAVKVNQMGDEDIAVFQDDGTNVFVIKDDGDTEMQGKLTVNNDVSMNQNVDVSGNVTIGGTLTVSGDDIVQVIEDASTWQKEDGTNNIFKKITTGNVGIGTTSPGHTLDVHGDVNATGTVSANSVSATTFSSTGDLNVGGDVGISGDLEVDGGLTLGASDVEVKGGGRKTSVAISTQPTYAWEFRDATGTAVVYDWAGGVAATIAGDTHSTSEGMVFDGANDYVDLPAISFGGGSMTVEMFFNLDTIATNERIFSFFTNNSDWFDLRFASNSGTLTFNSTTSSSVTIASTLSTNVWIHLTMVIDDPNNQIIFYKDGSVLETESASFTVPSGSRANGALFAFQDGASNYGDGILAFFRIYDGTALSSSDVAILYSHRDARQLDFHVNDQLSLAITDNGLALPQYDVEMKGNELACTKPTYAWEFRNGTGTNTVYDLVGGVAAQPTSGASSSATGMYFDGVDDYVDITPFQMGGNNFSIELYVEMLDHGDLASQIFSAIDGTSGATDRIMICNGEGGYEGNLQFAIDSSSYDDWTGYFSASSGFVHIVLTMNGSSATAYKNGVKESTVVTLQAATLKSERTYYLGRSVNASLQSSTLMFNGTIAYFRIWQGTTLSASEVEFLYNTRETKYTQYDFKNQLDFHVNSQLSLAITENGLALPQYDVEMKGNELACTKPTYAWEFRNATGTNTVYDLVSGVAAAPTNGAASTSEGMDLDGTNDYIDIGDVTMNGTFSIEIYLRPDAAVGAYERFFELRTTAAYKVYLVNGTNYGVWYWNNENGAQTDDVTASLSTGVFKHFVLVQDSTTMRLYDGGSQISYDTAAAGGSYTADIFHIGANMAGTDNCEMTVAYCRVWNSTALSASEVEFLYNTRETKYTHSDFRLFHRGLDFHVNSQLSLAITENGLALPQYDVEMKGKYTAASVEPTYAWEFRNATGAAPVYDMVGGVAATPTGGVLPTSTNDGMVFDVSSGHISRLELGNGAIGGSNQMTFETYVNYSGFSGTQHYFHYLYNPDLMFRSYQGKIHVLSDGTNSTSKQTATSILNTNGWNHIVVVLRPGVFEIYLNNSLIATFNDANFVDIPLLNLSAFYIGHYSTGHGTPGGIGTIAYTRVWDGTALSASDVGALYRSRNVVNHSQLDFHVNNQLSLAVSENGLALPQYDVEVKGNELACTKPTYAWEFRNNTTTNTVYDLVGGVAATPNGNASSNDTGMVFDGTGDYVELTPFEMGGNFSIELYVNMTNSSTSYSRIFEAMDMGSSSGSSVATNRIMVSNYGATTGLNFSYISNNRQSSTAYFSSSNFVHIVMTINSTSLKVYNNGTKDTASGLATALPSTISSIVREFYYLGRSGNPYWVDSDNREFAGTIAYFRVWQGTVLSASEVEFLYNTRETKYTHSDFRLFHRGLDFHVNNQLSLAVTENGLALPQYDVEMKGKYTAASVEPTYAWEFRNATGAATVYDMVNGVTATPAGNASSSSAGMVFDGINDYLQLGDIEVGGGSVTIEIYINQYSSTTSNHNWIFNLTSASDGNAGSNSKPIAMKLNGTPGSAFLQIWDSTGNSSDTSVEPDLKSWAHYVIVLEASTGTLYYNGGSGTSYAGINTPTAQTFTSSVLGALGRTFMTGYTSLFGFNGAIAYFRMWDGTALSASDVARLYAHRNAVGPGLQIHSNNELALGITQNTLSMPRYNLVMEAKNNVGVAISTQPTYAWEFRDATGTAVVNDWVSGVAATMYGDAHSTSEGLVLDGTGDYVELTPWSMGDTFTIEIYVVAAFEATADDVIQGLLDFGNAANSENIYIHRRERNGSNSNEIHYSIQVAGGYIGGAAGDVFNNDFTHITMVIEPNIQKMYKDGSLIHSDTHSGALSTTTRSKHYLGKTWWTSSGGFTYNQFKGTIAYCRVWNSTALSASDVATLYSNRENKESFNFNVRGKSALTVAQGAAEFAGALSVGGRASVGGQGWYMGTGDFIVQSAEQSVTVSDSTNVSVKIIAGGNTSSSPKHTASLYLCTPTDSSTSPALKTALIAETTGWSRATLHFCLNNDSDNTTNTGISDARMTILPSGNVGIGDPSPSQLLDVAGTILTNGTTVTSDERIKKNIVDLSDNEALETLRLIEPKKYEYVDQKSRTDQVVYGYIAQQIKDVLPYAVEQHTKPVPNIYSYADISSEIVYTESPDISAVSIVGISTIYVDVSNVNTSAEVSMNVVMVEQSDISQNAVFSEAELEDGTKVHKLTFNGGYNTASLHESSNILRVMDASNQEYHITITNIETSYRLEIEEDLSGLVNAQGELFVAGQRVPQNVYKLVFPAFDTATLDASSTTLKLVDASDVTQYVSIASVLDSSTLQIDDDLQYMILDSSNQLFVYGQKVSKSLTSLTFDGSYNVSSISENLISLKVLDTSGQPHDVKVYSKESNRLLLDEDISGKISYGASGELFVQGQNMNTTKHILTIQNYDTANLDASSTTLCLYDYNNAKHEVSIVSVIDGSNIEISQDPTSFAHEGQVFVYGQKVDDFHTLSKEYINVVTLSAVQELDRALTKVTEEKDELQTKYDVLETKYDALEARVLALEGASST